MNDTISLTNFVRAQRERLIRFQAWYERQHVADPETYPNPMNAVAFDSFLRLFKEYEHDQFD